MQPGGDHAQCFLHSFLTSRFAIKHHPRSEIIWSLMDISTIFKNERFIYWFSMIFMSLCLLRCWWLIHLRWCSLCWLDLPTASSSKHQPRKEKVCSKGGTMPNAFYILFDLKIPRDIGPQTSPSCLKSFQYHLNPSNIIQYHVKWLDAPWMSMDI